MKADLILAQCTQDQAWSALQEWYDNCPPDVRDSLIGFLESNPERTRKTILKEMRRLDLGSLEIIRRLTIHVFYELALRKVIKEEEVSG